MSRSKFKIDVAQFHKSSAEPSQCPLPDRPEYAFIGRSNVGKSSLINMLTGRNKLAKTSGTPGKTQLINHFDIDDTWYLVDLPGYGFAKAPTNERRKWTRFTWEYLENRENLMCVFCLVDGRIPAQQVDLDFINNLGAKGIPLIIIFTKMEKVKPAAKAAHYQDFSSSMLINWETMPPYFYTSASSKLGKEEVLDFIGKTNKSFVKPKR